VGRDPDHDPCAAGGSAVRRRTGRGVVESPVCSGERVSPRASSISSVRSVEIGNRENGPSELSWRPKSRIAHRILP
jgi:hypothetical protein